MIRLACSMLVVAGLVLSLPRVASAQEEIDVFARVVVSETSLRSGPGVSHRVAYRAERGEMFIVQGREGAGFWLRVLLSDGRQAYVLGDTVEAVAIDPEADDAPSAPGLFAPPALQEARGGFSIAAGVFDLTGYAELKPAIVLAPAIAIEPFVGLALSNEGNTFVYGAGGTLNVAPDWAVAPYVHIGGGAITTSPNEDAFALGEGTKALARAGGGLLISLRWRILVRLEAMHNVLFEPDFSQSVQSYVGGLGTYF